MPERHKALLQEQPSCGARIVLLVLVLGSLAWAGAGFDAEMARIESRLNGRIGVFAMRGPTVVSHRAGERFAYCSTFKWVLAAAVLKGVDEARLDLAQVVTFNQRDLLPHSPVTRARLMEGRMDLGTLCAATIGTSDNAAANLLEPLVGGPTGLQDFVRSLGDTVMRFDRIEPELNSNLPGDPRDTTSPEAMARLLKTVMETEALSRTSRDRLLAWMKATTTGAHRIRAGAPPGWTVGNKTGTGGNGAAHDVGVLISPKGPPVYVCIFTESARTGDRAREAAIAKTTRLVLKALQ